MSCRWAQFLIVIGSHTVPGQRHSQPTPTALGQDVCVFRCNPPPALLAEWLGSFMCHCGNTGVGWMPNKSQHTKLTLEKKILLPLLTGFKLATFWSRVWSSNQQAILAPSYPWPKKVTVGWLCCPSGKWAHILVIRERLSAVTSAQWAAVDCWAKSRYSAHKLISTSHKQTKMCRQESICQTWPPNPCMWGKSHHHH